ncbi:serine/threonine-protein phosphatase 2A 55 kDa regulatory subunit B delta isoform isoform X2 [Monodelphis domestica]|uniref:serine/threonine-protein phosphatase 2A 55 kDa regulatory subunit B delta isoform isoform X2 n=1 Tax=Monodelphis domestica TaxID=13616 RepID=UPI0024E1E0B5|nr:serine/threonine-protein phosphatase 2A 55 kDa regulatory subunit B delta isoform isoform X2 [Monodelphis domestica]
MGRAGETEASRFCCGLWPVSELGLCLLQASALEENFVRPSMARYCLGRRQVAPGREQGRGGSQQVALAGRVAGPPSAHDGGPWAAPPRGEADIISTVEFNHSGDLLATGDKGGRVVIFQKEHENKSRPHSRGEYNVYSTFQSHEPEFDYLKSLEIEEKINKIRWLPQQNAAHFLLSTNDKTIKLWKISERDKRAEGYNLKDEDGRLRNPFRITALRVPILKPTELMVEASPRRVFANAHTYHINSISVNSDHETYLSADDLRINLWHLEITNRSFNIVDIKPVNMEELTEVITAAEFHPHQCNVFVYSSSKGTIRLCDMRSSALCDRHSKFFEEPEDPSSRSFFSEIISSISDVKFSHGGRYMMTRDYLSVKVWDLNMESRPVETYQVHEYLRSKLCSLYENDCIFDKFECCWSGSDSALMTGSYNNFFRMFDRSARRDVTLEASRESSKPRAVLKPRKVCPGGKRKKDEISADSLDFNRKILHTAWHPLDNVIAVAATNNLYIFQDKIN